MRIFCLLYQVFSSLLLLCALPMFPLLLRRAKHRQRLGQRLGWGLKEAIAPLQQAKGKPPIFWVHALSVGEVTSAVPLVQGLRQQYPQAVLLFSATTKSGAEVAATLLAPWVDRLIAAPLDLGPVVPFFLHTIRPDCFIQVETDFWPHWLLSLRLHRIPAILVNGRISARSLARYQRLALLFRPMFACFSLLAMQSESDARNLQTLGIDAARITTLGNLKFDSRNATPLTNPPCPQQECKSSYGFAATAPLWICGSTHAGEEAIISAVFSRLIRSFPTLQLLIAPRNIERSDEIQNLAVAQGLDCRRRTTGKEMPGPLLILDTIGELAGCYVMADMVFVGGSLVASGGHNPLEPAAVGVPVLFGKHMEDFSEIAQELIDQGGAWQVGDAIELEQRLRQLLVDTAAAKAMGQRAADCVAAHRGVVANHLAMIDQVLAGAKLGG